MDDELKGKTKSRNFDTMDEQEGNDNNNEEMAENVHVLNNLLQSLNVSRTQFFKLMTKYDH